LEIDHKKVNLDEECYAKMMGVKPHFELNVLKKSVNKILEIVNGYIAGMDHFTFQKFEMLYKKKMLRTVKDYFDQKKEELREKNSIRTASLYDCTYKSLLRFDKNLTSLRQITPEFLEKYERDFIKKGGSATSVGMYMRNVRAIMNQAKDDGVIKPQEYPFSRKKYIIPAGSKSRKILTHEQIKVLYQCKDLNPFQEKARDFWVFSYLANGMNMIDILLLKYKNCEGDTFCFVRHKTKNTTKSNPINIKVIITDPLKNIMQKWGNPDKNPDNYIFPVLTREPVNESDFNKVERFIRFVNQHMKSVTQKLELPKVSTYTARHSYATEMLKNKANIIEIADSLGHTTITLTRDYVNSLDEEAKRHYANKLAEL
jgi:integrase/recombinase XerD